jgi:hypothetical protein
VSNHDPYSDSPGRQRSKLTLKVAPFHNALHIHRDENLSMEGCPWRIDTLAGLLAASPKTYDLCAPNPLSRSASFPDIYLTGGRFAGNQFRRLVRLTWCWVRSSPPLTVATDEKELREARSDARNCNAKL